MANRSRANARRGGGERQLNSVGQRIRSRVYWKSNGCGHISITIIKCIDQWIARFLRCAVFHCRKETLSLPHDQYSILLVFHSSQFILKSYRKYDSVWEFIKRTSKFELFIEKRTFYNRDESSVFESAAKIHAARCAQKYLRVCKRYLGSQPKIRQLVFLSKRTGCSEYGSIFANQKKQNNVFKTIFHLHGYSLFYL